MDNGLEYWEQRLSSQFAKLRDQRQADGDRPVFGLEHGLQPREVRDLEAAVRAHISRAPPLKRHALSWIVYSSELGYRYVGNEYWQTFEEETPGWVRRGDRYWIRDRYLEFEREFGGARPSGAWAAHFTIICWPITHAILPKDLQRQLARVLYDLRHHFSGENLKSPRQLGQLVAARSWSSPSRFRNFAQETQFLGQIVRALLFQGEFDTGGLIDARTVSRISRDLSLERQAREWLQGARWSAKEHVQVRGLEVGATSPVEVAHSEKARAKVAALGIEPRLVLRPTAVSRGSWEVSLEVPDLSHILQRFPETRAALAHSRCRVAGSSGRPLARGRFLYGAQCVRLVQWPQPTEMLLQFERRVPQLEHLLGTECLLRPGSTWLFRVAADGVAYECRAFRVRPSKQYILARTTAPFRPSDHVQPVDLACDGIHGALIKLPGALSAGWEETLRRLELRQARRIEVWPVGLGAAVWGRHGPR